MSKLITKVELPIYGGYYVPKINNVSFEAVESMQKILKKLYEYEQKYENDEE